MGDLISRSALIREIEGMYLNISGVRSGKGFLSIMLDSYKKNVLDVIKNQPTAYDVDKVVAGLKKWSCNADIIMPYSKEVISRRIIASKNAIDIVKRGGRDE